MSPQQTIAHYRITSKLGEGGMGEVWRATDTKLNREVAIKFLPDAFANDSDRLARFQREAQVLASLNHPNIAAIYGVEEWALVMELVEGSTLAEQVARGPMAPEEALPIARQIAEAFEYAHERGIVHRDLKPANIKITPQGRVKVLDFGLAKALASEPASGDPAVSPTLTMRATLGGTIMGTAAYMAPEQARGQSVDRRADIWAFGVVLYEMLAGRQLFGGATISDTLAAVLRSEIDWSPIPPRLRPALERCLRREPRERWHCIGDAGDATERAADPALAPASPRRAAAWVAAALALGAFGGWATVHLPRTPTDDRVIRFLIDPPQDGQIAFGNGVGGIALSPDGRTLAFVAVAGGKTMLWVRPLGETTSRPIAGTEGAYSPVWSPDGRSIVFFTRNMVKRVGVAGGIPMKISETPGLARGGAWTSDGRILFGSFDSGLFQVLATGGNPRKVTNAEARGDAWHRWPQLFPGGFIYQARSDKSGASGVFAASWDKPEEPVRLLDIDSGALYAEAGGQGYLLWLRGTTLVGQAFDPAALKFSGEPHPVADPVAGGITSLGQPAATAGSGVLAYSASSPAGQFTWMDRTGKRLAALGDLSEYAMFRLSPDGHRVAALRYASGGLDLWMLDVARGVASLFPAGSKVSYPVWSPDGKTVVFRYGNSNLFRKDASGAGSEARLTQSPNIQSSTDWSRDGRWILYHETAQGTGQDLWVLPVTSEGRVAPGSAPKPYVRTKDNELRGRFSPESPPKWVAYESDETGKSEIYVQSFPEPRDKIRISTNGGRYPQWGGDSRELFYVSLDGELMSVGLRSSVDSLEPSAPRELFPLPAMEMGWSPYEATADGQRFLVRATPGRAGAPLTVIVNWPALLKKESSAP